MIKKLSFTFILLTPVAAMATGVISNEYSLDSGMGYINILPPHAGGQSFDIQTYGSNGSSCTLKGNLKGWTGIVASPGDSGTECKININQTEPDTVTVETVKTSPNHCSGWCGAGASFDGTYKASPNGCYSFQITGSRREFLDAVKAGNDNKAYRIAETMLTHCRAQLPDSIAIHYKLKIAETSFTNHDFPSCSQLTQEILSEAKIKSAAAVPKPASSDVLSELINQARQLNEKCAKQTE